jgi:hypothetical protein
MPIDDIGVISASLTEPDEMARHLRQRFGEEAALIAWRMADHHAMSGDESGYEKWLAVLDRLK